MKKDIGLRIIKALKFIFREAKKPMLHTKFHSEITLLPTKAAEEKGLPKMTLEGDVKIGLLYFLLSVIALFTSIRLIFKILF